MKVDILVYLGFYLAQCIERSALDLEVDTRQLINLIISAAENGEPCCLNQEQYKLYSDIISYCESLEILK